MASALRRLNTASLLKLQNISNVSQANISIFSKSKSYKNMLLAAAGVAGVSGTALIYALDQSVKAEGMILHPPKLPWSHNGPFSSFDHASIRRGFQVYKEVCSACHSIKYLAYRHLVNVCMTEEEAKTEANDVLIRDGPDDKGDMFERPGKLADYFPSPYPNDEAAKAANNGAMPPDLSYITYARHGGEDYIFSILTGYNDPPAGITLGEGQHYNPYFPGGAISMAQALYNEVIEYPDGTPATQSQCAKDVLTFLAWVASPEHDERKQLAIKVIMYFAVFFPLVYYYKRHTWTSIKSRKIVFKPDYKRKS